MSKKNVRVIQTWRAADVQVDKTGINIFSKKTATQVRKNGSEVTGLTCSSDHWLMKLIPEGFQLAFELTESIKARRCWPKCWTKCWIANRPQKGSTTHRTVGGLVTLLIPYANWVNYEMICEMMLYVGCNYPPPFSNLLRHLSGVIANRVRMQVTVGGYS